jgi:hypothetical protein
MPLLGRILGAAATLGATEVVRAIDEDAGESVTKVANCFNPTSWVAHGIEGAVRWANGERCTAAGAAFQAIPFNPVVIGSEVHKLFRARAGAKDWVGKKTLYHVTNAKAANMIRRTYTMKSGKEGVLGAGVYFATSVEAGLKKAVHIKKGDRYGVIKAEVDLGYCKQVAGSHAIFRTVVDGGMDPGMAKRSGFHSIGAVFNGGQEYVVFDEDRVAVMSVAIR